MSKIIKISCDVQGRAPLHQLKEFQGELKSLSKEAYEQLKDSLVSHGITMPIFVWNNEGQLHILDGHQRKRTYLAMMEEGYDFPEAIPIVTVDAPTIDEAKQILLTMVSQYGQVERQGLYQYMHDANIDFKVIEERYRLPDTNLETFRIEFIDDNTVAPGKCDEDEIPETSKNVKTKLGDIYQLGNHRLRCGDSSDLYQLELLMNGEKSDITFTSPPYNVGKTPNGNDNKYLTYDDNQSSEDYRTLLRDFTTNCLTVSKYIFSNIQSLSGNKTPLIEYLYDLRDNYADTIIWDKETSEPAMARRVLNSQFEYIHVFSHEAKRTIGTRDFRGTISNIFSLNSRAGKEYSKVHKETFRVELPQYFIENFSEKSCLDPFGGTGTTLIACEKTNRKCFTMELDPYYCDVIIARWEKFSGKQAYLLNEDGTQTEWATL